MNKDELKERPAPAGLRPDKGDKDKGGRNYGIDLLRLVCMYLICVLHVCGQGGAMTHYIGREASWYTVYILETAGYCAVNTYGMISGYVGISSRRRPSRIVELWLRVFWYSALGSLIGVNVFGLPVDEKTLWKAIFPTMWNTYWYFSSYVGVFVIAPYLNRMVRALSDGQKKKLMITLFLLCSVFTMVPRASTTGGDFLGLGAGYSFLWLAVMYVMGACVRLLTEQGETLTGKDAGSSQVSAIPGQEPENVKKRKGLLNRGTSFYVILYTACVLLTWISKILIENYSRGIYGEPRYGRLLFSYTGPTIVICAFALLMIFSRIRIRGSVPTAIIRFLAPLAFSVYLVQVHPYFWNYYLKGRYSFIALQSPLPAFFLVLFWAAVLYLECTAIDLIRMLVFRLIPVRKMTEKLTDFVLRPLNRLEKQ